jgi:Kdo2-lipid IVA lauroyltransferase/acyltransferase
MSHRGSSVTWRITACASSPSIPFARLRSESIGNADLDAAMNRMCANIGRVYTEYCILDLLWAAGRGMSTSRSVASATDRLFVFGVHLSNWEVVGAALLGLGYGVCTLYKPTRNRFQDRIANAVRLRGGAELVPPGPRGARRAYRALTDRRCVFLTWVDEAIDGSIRAPAFGRPMHRRDNLAAMVRLARSTGSRSPPLSSANGAHVSTLRSDRPSNSSRQRMRTPRCSPTCSD